MFLISEKPIFNFKNIDRILKEVQMKNFIEALKAVPKWKAELSIFDPGIKLQVNFLSILQGVWGGETAIQVPQAPGQGLAHVLGMTPGLVSHQVGSLQRPGDLVQLIRGCTLPDLAEEIQARSWEALRIYRERTTVAKIS